MTAFKERSVNDYYDNRSAQFGKIGIDFASCSCDELEMLRFQDFPV